MAQDQLASLRLAQATLIVVVGLSMLSGCNSKPMRQVPATFPVAGELKPVNGKLPVGALIEFKPIRHEKPIDFTANGIIGADGKFSLRIPYIDQLLTGAVEGPHTARIILPVGSKFGDGAVKIQDGIVEIPGEFTVKPSENQFTVTVPTKQ
jgi:hypothetical protein